LGCEILNKEGQAGKRVLLMTKQNLHLNTPIVSAPFLASKLGVNQVLLKLDNLQPSSSFKIRGLGHCIQKALESNPNLRTLVSSSGGNAGYAATLAAKHFGLAIFVFVPTTTSSTTIEQLQSNGASVIVHGSVWDETHLEAMRYLNELDQGTGFYVHPFEHEDIFQGHSSLVKEIVEEVGEPDVIICSVGGGGLLCGILTGLLQTSRKTVVVAVETEGAASFASSVKDDRLVTLDGIHSIAKSLGAKRVSEATLRLRSLYGKNLVRPFVVSDRDALDGVIDFANQFRFLVEPACGASLALVLNPKLLRKVIPELSADSKVVVEVCGGFQVTLEMIEEWKIALG
jgi:L-serine/L-threonine ammonia-lyase